MDIGSKIKEYRNIKDLTQVELAGKADISRSYLGDIEKNRYNASVETLQKIAGALEIQLGALLTNEDKLNLINDTINQYQASKSNVEELELDAETNLFINKIKKLSKKDRIVIEVLVDQLLKEE